MRIKLLGQYVHASIVALALIEALVCFTAPHLAVLIRFGPAVAPMELPEAAGGALVFAAAMMLGMTAMGLYSFQQRSRAIGVMARLFAAAVLASVVLVTVLYMLPDLAFGRGLLALSCAISMVGCGIVRLIWLYLFNEDLLKRRVLVYGAGRRAQSITQLRRRTDRRGFVIAGFLPSGEEQRLVPEELVIHSDLSLYEEVVRRGVSEVVVAIDDQRRRFPTTDLLNCRLRGITVVDVVTFLERETGKVRVDMLNPSWLIFSEGFRKDPVRAATERFFDVLFSSLFLVLSSPLMALVAIAIKLEDGWRAPVMYSQTRVGLEGRGFKLFKFRSMRVDAETDGQVVWAAKQDARVTRVGSLIRRTRLDEVPQMLNVLKGDMSFVGPRPERPEFVDMLSERIPYYRERHWVRPGITGWAQLCYPYGASERDAKEKLQYDLYYVKHRSLVFDILILMGTAEIVLWGKGVR